MAGRSRAAGVLAELRYQDSSVQRTLLANGQISTRRDQSGSDAPIVGARWAHVAVEVRDARQLAPAAALDMHGFELRRCPTLLAREQFYDEGSLFGKYFGECIGLVKAATGAAVVRAFDYNVRSASGSKARTPVQGGSTTVQPPAQAVHNDYTLTSGPARLRQLAAPPRLNDVSRRIHGEAPLITLREAELAASAGFAIVNVWRNIHEEPVRVLPLACCDARSVAPDDLCVFEIHYADRVGENYFAAHDPRHAWYYYPSMARDEALLIKQWDSRGALATGSGTCSTFSMHTAFNDPTTPEGSPDRESIEVRCLCIFDAGCASPTIALGGQPRPSL